MKIKESLLKNIITECVKKSINEGVFGLNGDDLKRWGLKNPADNYNVNKEELMQKTLDFLNALREYHSYIYGTEEDLENGTEEKQGAYFNMQLRSMWNDDEDERYYAEYLKKISYKLSSMDTELQEMIDYYCK